MSRATPTLSGPTRVVVRAHNRWDGAAQRIVTWHDPLTGAHRRTVPLNYGASDAALSAIRRVFGDSVIVGERVGASRGVAAIVTPASSEWEGHATPGTCRGECARHGV